jgi:hypothetical protein
VECGCTGSSWYYWDDNCSTMLCILTGKAETFESCCLLSDDHYGRSRGAGGGGRTLLACGTLETSQN